MAHHNTVFAQMLKFIPTCLSRQGHEFDALANPRHCFGRLSNHLVAHCAR